MKYNIRVSLRDAKNTEQNASRTQCGAHSVAKRACDQLKRAAHTAPSAHRSRAHSAEQGAHRPSRALSAEQGAHAINSAPPHERAAPSAAQKTKNKKTTASHARARQRRRFGSDEHNRHYANDVIVDRRPSTWRSDSSRQEKRQRKLRPNRADRPSFLFVRTRPKRRLSFSQQHKQRTQHDNNSCTPTTPTVARHVPKQTKKINLFVVYYLRTRSRMSVNS